MQAFVVTGGDKLHGEIHVSGAKNSAMKAVCAGLLTDETIEIENVPFISSLFGTIDVVKHLGVNVRTKDNHILHIKGDALTGYTVPLELGGMYRTATMVIGPLLSRFGKAIVPNPGGCRIGKRPIDWHIEGLRKLGAKIIYKDGYFYAEAKKLHGARFRFEKNSHTGTETLLLAAVISEGETVLENAAEEPEVDDLIVLLNKMGGKIRRTASRTIAIEGVKKLHGVRHSIIPDRNEAVTFAVCSLATGGDIIVHGARRDHLEPFLSKLSEIGAKWKEVSKQSIRFTGGGKLRSTHVTTGIHPGFMTDWQSPWTILMTQAHGTSTVHETIYEERFGYVYELMKMGADVDFFNPHIDNPSKVYNFNWRNRKKTCFQALKIHGPAPLHNAVLEVSDLRAGATLVIAAAAANGTSYIRGVAHIDRGYDHLERRLSNLGLKIKRIQEE